ncbi:MAG: alpha-amylase [Bacteroidales bacterium]|nr:alpha-amlyase [Bacteroidales bacterium]MBQ6688375.1 alpha-amylase [Bacteroidales bacterium]
MNRIFSLIACLSLTACASQTAGVVDRMTHDPNSTNTETILHVWSWNFNTIAENMKQIADAGFTMLQTSPVNACFSPEGGNIRIYDEKEGNWYHYYQPVDWTIGNNILGTEDEMAVMLDSARKYDIRVLVDVLPNHTAFDIDLVTDSFYEAVGGRDKMFHTNGLEGIQDYNDRRQCTLQGVGGLPDVNTENPLFQKYYMEFVNKLIRMGVRGFRYDTAKHIGVHSDPLDEEAGVKENDFWDVATGRKKVLGVSLAIPYDSLFVYGEVLQDRNVPEEEYAGYFGQTASSYGHVLREALTKRSAKNMDLVSWYHRAAPEYLTTWVESHDTYCNANESAGLTDGQIRMGWVFLAARQNGTPLFYSRPMNSTRDNYWGDNLLGARGNDEFFHPEVVAVNNFRKQMDGQAEDIVMSADGEVLVVNRGDKGLAAVNLALEVKTAELPTGLPDGEYADIVYKQTFSVENGVLKGIMQPETSYIIVKK